MQDAARSPKRISLGVAVGAAVFFLALAIRLIGIGWGLKNDLHNASYHPDEPVVFGYSRQIVVGQGQFVPHFYNYGTLYLTLLRIASDMTTTYTGGPKVQGDGYSMTNPQRTDWDWVSRCDLAGRFLTALSGAGTALMVCLMTRRFFGVWAGALAGFFIAIAPAHVVHSRFQTVDVPAVFFLSCSLYFAIKIVTPVESEPGFALRDAIWCGVFAGLSAGTKYTGLVVLLSLVAAIWIARPKDAAKSLVAGVIAATGVFVATTPGIVLEWPKFISDVSFELAHTSSGHGLLFVGTPNGFAFHALNLLIGIGPILVAVGAAGLVWAGYRKHAWALVLLAFFVPYYLLIGKAEVKFLRYTFPLYVALAAGFGYCVIAAHRRGGWGRAVVGVSILGVGGIPFGGMLGAIQFTQSMTGPDPRDLAARLLKQTNEPVGLAKDPWFWTAPIFPDAAEPRSVPWSIRVQQMQASLPPVLYVGDPDGPKVIWDKRLITELKPPRIEISSFELDPMRRLRGVKGLEPAIQAEVDADSLFLDELDRNYTLEKWFNDPLPMVEDLEYVRPTVYVWKRKTP